MQMLEQLLLIVLKILGTLEIDNYKEFISNIDDENKKTVIKIRY